MKRKPAAMLEQFTMKPTEQEIERIAEAFSDDERTLPCRCLEVAEPLSFSVSRISCQSRLVRAAENQICSGDATLSRYRIWAETLRGSLMSVVEDLDRQPDENTRRNVVLVANSLAAFCEIQACFEKAKNES